MKTTAPRKLRRKSSLKSFINTAVAPSIPPHLAMSLGGSDARLRCSAGSMGATVRYPSSVPMMKMGSPRSIR